MEAAYASIECVQSLVYRRTLDLRPSLAELVRYTAAIAGTYSPFIKASIRSAMRCAGSRSCLTVQSAA